MKQHSLKVTRDTVDGRNPAPVDIEIPLLNIFYRVFYTSQVVVRDFFHQPPPPALADGIQVWRFVRFGTRVVEAFSR